MKSKIIRSLSLTLLVLSGGCLWMDARSNPPAQKADLQALVDQQIQQGRRCVVIPPGRYAVTPKNGVHLNFQNLTNLEIVAEGVELVCTETCGAIRIQQCRNFKLHGLTIDYDPLPMTEGRIVALAEDKSWVEFELYQGYPDGNLVERIEIFDPATQELRRDTYYGWDKFQPLAPGRYRVAKGANYKYRPEVDTEQVGDVLVTNHAFPARAGGHAVQLSRCRAVTLENVTLYASPCFGFLEDECDGNTYQHCVIDRRSPQNDPVRRGYPRMRSLDADAYHSKDAVKGPALLQCVAKFMGDDAVNINGHYYLVTQCAGAVLRVGAPSKLNIAVGDPVEFLPYQGERPPDAVVTAIEPDGPVTEEEKSFVKKQGLTPHLKERLMSGEMKFYRLTLNREVALPMGSLIASANRVGNGFRVQGCDFGYNRSRGILIKASHGQVLDNKITHSWMAGVLVSPEFYWFEAGSACDVLIARNEITGCRQPAIRVEAPGGKGQALPSGAHDGITIVSNRISGSVWPNIFVASTAHLILRDNRLTESNPPDFTAGRGKTNGKRFSQQPIHLEACQSPEVQPGP